MNLTQLPRTDPATILRYRDGLYAVDLLGAAISEFDLFTWLGANPSDFETICVHLLVIAMRFHKDKVYPARDALLKVVIELQGEGTVTDQLVKAGVEASAAAKLIAQTKKSGPALAKGLAPPTASGTSLRKKR